MLEVKGLSSGYGRVEVLRRLSLRVEHGEVVCLLGANGAGKTTLIRTILGLVRPTGGEIQLEGRSLVGLTPDRVHALGVGVVPEGKRLFPKMSVRENLRIGAFLIKDEREVNRRMEEVMGLFPWMRERAHQLAGTLSGGEQSMCAIGRALMSRPKLLLMDEPSFGLAPVLVSETFRIIQQINEGGTTVLLVEQNATGSLRVASRGYVMQKGEIIIQGAAEALMENPEVQKAYLMAGTAYA